MSCFPTENLKE